MKKKTLLSMFLAAAMTLTSCMASVLAAPADATVVYNLDPSTLASGNISAGDKSTYGFQGWGLCWSTPSVIKDTSLGDSVWLLSTRKNKTEDKTYGYNTDAKVEYPVTKWSLVNNDSYNLLDRGCDIVEYELNFGVAMKSSQIRMAFTATDGTTESEMCNLIFNRDSGKTTGTVAIPDITKNDNGEFNKTDQVIALKNVKGEGTANFEAPSKYSTMVALFNMSAKTVTIKITQDGTEETLAADMPFVTDTGASLLKPANIRFYVTNSPALGYENIRTTGMKTTVYAKAVDGSAAAKIEADPEASGNAVGFYADTAISGDNVKVGFKLNDAANGSKYRLNQNQPVISGNANVKYGIIITGEENEDLSGVSADTYYTQAVAE